MLRSAVRIVSIFSVLLASTLMAGAESPVPQFRDYPASGTLVGPRHPLVLDKKNRDFRTRLRLAAKKPPNFAGFYVLETWGCGSSCMMGAVINLRTGHVTAIPFTVCCATPSDDKFNPVEFRPGSRLVIFAGLRDEKEPMGAHFYEFDGKSFKFIRTIPDDGSFKQLSH